MSKSPYLTVVTSTATYSTILAYLYNTHKTRDELRTLIKSISACHSLLTTGLTLWVLSQPWPTAITYNTQPITKTESTGLDDTDNPLITGTKPLANALTAWEAGYLLYDTGALLLVAHHKTTASNRSPQFRATVLAFLKDNPIFVVHHALLAGALLYLQTYIAMGKEKGMKIIISFLLMNASNPLLHLRWYQRKTTGRDDRRVDAVLALVFALSRFGVVGWVCRAYGAHHGLSAWDALRRQRTVCQGGTGALVGVNLIWWLGLL